jgi:hypothetical protein
LRGVYWEWRQIVLGCFLGEGSCIVVFCRSVGALFTFQRAKSWSSFLSDISICSKAKTMSENMLPKDQRFWKICKHDCWKIINARNEKLHFQGYISLELILSSYLCVWRIWQSTSNDTMKPRCYSRMVLFRVIRNHQICTRQEINYTLVCLCIWSKGNIYSYFFGLR